MKKIQLIIIVILCAIFFSYWSLAWAQGSVQQIAPGQSITLTNESGTIIRVMVNGKFEYTIYYNDGSAYSKRKNADEIEISPGTRLVLTNIDLSTYEITTSTLVEIYPSDKPAVTVKSLQPGKSIKVYNGLQGNLLTRVDGNFDMVIHDKTGTIRNYYHGTKSLVYIPAEGHVIITNIDANAYDVYGAYEGFSSEESTEPALRFVSLDPGESIWDKPSQRYQVRSVGDQGKLGYIWYNDIEGSEIQGLGIDTGKYYFQPGFKQVVTNLDSQTLNLYAPFQIFNPNEVAEPAMRLFVLQSGKSITFTNEAQKELELGLRGANNKAGYAADEDPYEAAITYGVTNYEEYSTAEYIPNRPAGSSAGINAGARGVISNYGSNDIDIVSLYHDNFVPLPSETPALKFFEVEPQENVAVVSQNQFLFGMFKPVKERAYSWYNGYYNMWFNDFDKWDADEEGIDTSSHSGGLSVIKNTYAGVNTLYGPYELFSPVLSKQPPIRSITLFPGDTISFINMGATEISIGGSYEYFMYTGGWDGVRFKSAKPTEVLITNTSNQTYRIRGPYDAFDPEYSSQSAKEARENFKNPINKIRKQNPDLIDPSSLEGDPVDTSTGAHLLEHNLFNLNGARKLSFDLGYNSLLLNQGWLGKGWGHNYEIKLETLVDGSIKVHWTANRYNIFSSVGDRQFVSSDSATRYDRLTKNEDGSFILKTKDKNKYVFDSLGRLIEQENRNGERLSLTYNNLGQLEKITEPLTGQQLALTYNQNGLINKIMDNIDRQVIFSYDGANNLSSITDTGGNKVTYEYDSMGRVLKAYDAKGLIFVNTYDDKGRVSTQDDARIDNEVTIFKYDEESEPGRLITTVYDRNGNEKVLTHDSTLRLLKIRDQIGQLEKTFAYDHKGNKITEIDANGNTTKFTYDDRGNVIEVTDPAGYSTKLTYDDRNNLKAVENAAQKLTTYNYDTNNNLVEIVDTLGNKTTFAYDPNGNLLEKVTPRLGRTQYAYEEGLLTTVTNATYRTSIYEYDSVGRIVYISDSLGRKTRLTYDNADNLTSIIDPMGHNRSFTYDQRRNKLSETDARGNTTWYKYNNNDQLESVTDALFNTSYYKYDGEDRLIEIIDAQGNTVRYHYDGKGRLTGITDQLGQTITMAYDSVGNLVYKLDALGNKIDITTYDALNNPETITDALGNRTYLGYDYVGRLSRIKDPLGNITKYSYDDINRLSSVTDALDNMGQKLYNQDGNLASLIDPNKNETIFGYDLSGKLISQTTTDGFSKKYTYNTAGFLEKITNARGQIINYYYDDSSRLESYETPEGTTDINYDQNGNILSIKDGQGTIAYQYDQLNRVTKYTDVKGNVILYDYDSVGNLVYLTYPNGKKVEYVYDGAKRLTHVIDWLGRTTKYQYDHDNRLVATLRSDGSKETKIYDNEGQLTAIVDQDKQGNIINRFIYQYDAKGNIIKEESTNELPEYPGNKVQMFYTNDNRLQTYEGEAVSYDEDGNMMFGPLNQQILDYRYDSMNRLTQVGNTLYLYDAQNNRISVANGVYSTDYVVNPNAILSQVLVRTDFMGKETYYIYGLGLIGQEESDQYKTYHYDMRGSTVAISDANGTITDRIYYGPYGELIQQKGMTDTPFKYNGRDGVSTDQNELYYMRARYYNPEIKRFVNQDLLLGSIENPKSLNRYAYVNGEPISKVDPFGLKEFNHNFTIDALFSPLNTYEEKFQTHVYGDNYVVNTSSPLGEALAINVPGRSTSKGISSQTSVQAIAGAVLEENAGYLMFKAGLEAKASGIGIFQKEFNLLGLHLDLEVGKGYGVGGSFAAGIADFRKDKYGIRAGGSIMGLDADAGVYVKGEEVIGSIKRDWQNTKDAFAYIFG